MGKKTKEDTFLCIGLEFSWASDWRLDPNSASPSSKAFKVVFLASGDLDGAPGLMSSRKGIEYANSMHQGIRPEFR